MKSLYKILTLLVTLPMFMVTGCRDDYFDKLYGTGETSTVKIRVNMEKGVQTRSDFNVLGPADYLWAESHPMIGDGTRAKFLTYSLYEVNDDGTYTVVPIPGKDGVKEERFTVETTFPFDEIPEFTVAKNKDYVMVFWAQSKGKDVQNTYYNIDELQNIIARYDNQDLSASYDGETEMDITSVGQLNNIDARDVFCASYRFNVNQTTQTINVVLHRAVAQVNIGFTPEAWERLHNGNIDIKQSSISIAQVGRRINLPDNKIFLNPDENISNTTSYTIAGFSRFRIPEYMEFDSGLTGAQENMDYEQNRLDHCQRLIVDDQEYIWASMSYVLSPGDFSFNANAEDATRTVDIVDIKFYDGDGNDLGLPLTKLYNVPIRRNYRTNIILDEYFNTRLVMDMNISPDTYNDFKYVDGEPVEGTIAPGLSYRISNKTSKWGADVKRGIDFYVSSVHGLKWLADRSNGLDYKLSDIPVWIKDGKKTTYSMFAGENGEPDLKKYEDWIFKLVDGRVLVRSKINSGKFYRNNQGFRAPWGFEECTITLTNDIDFATDPDSAKDWHGFNCNLTSIGSGVNEWYSKEGSWEKDPETGKWRVKESGRGNEFLTTQTNHILGFMGLFDGNGYTIYNMKIDNTQNFIDEGGKKYMDGFRKLNNAALICTATSYAEIRNLRLYNADIKGDWNVGGFVGYFNESESRDIKGIEIVNCHFVNGSVEATMGESIAGSDDANVGIFGGSFPSNFLIKDCTVSGSVVKSGYIGGVLLGICTGNGTVENCTVSDTDLLHIEYNQIGTTNGNVATKGPEDERLRYLLGAKINGISYYPNMNGVTVVRPRENQFYGIKYIHYNGKNESVSSSEGSWGKSEIKDLDLKLVPEISTLYAQEIALSSHVLGTPSVYNGMKGYGIKIDATTQPQKESNTPFIYDKFTNKNGNVTLGDGGWIFTLKGNSNAQSQSMERFILNVQPGASTMTYAVHVTGDGDKNEIVVDNIIITGNPTVDYGIYFDKVKKATISNTAIYDVRNTFSDLNVPAGSELSFEKCDLRGRTVIGANYASVFVHNTAFNIGSGHKDNLEGTVSSLSDIVFDYCKFRTSFKLRPEKGVTYTLKNCFFGPPALAKAQSVEIVEQYLHNSSKTNHEVIEISDKVIKIVPKNS